MLQGTNQESGRPYNRRLVLEAIRIHAPTTRSEIAAHVGLTVQTVSTIVRELEEQGYVLAARDEPKGRGLPPTVLRVNPAGGYAIGVHVTPLGIGAALVGLTGDVVAVLRREGRGLGPDTAFRTIGELAQELKQLRPGSRILGVGMALPGPFGVDTMSGVGPTAMAGWENVPLQARLHEATGLPSFFETDMAAAALGERLYGIGADFSDFYYLFFGVGLGGVMVHEGAVLRGAWGNAGEIGHIPVVAGGEPCSCGNRGCLERYVSLEALRRRGVPDAQWLGEIEPVFGSAITVIENLFDPQTIILGGMAPEPLLQGLAALAERLPGSVSARSDRTAPRLLVAHGGQNSVLSGAAALAVLGTLSPRHGQMFGTASEAGAPQAGDIAA